MYATPPLHNTRLRATVGGLLAALALSVGFGLVVHRAVRQGEENRRVTALRVEANWRCKALKSDWQRESCLQRYQLEKPADSVSLQVLVVAAGAEAAPLARIPARTP